MQVGAIAYAFYTCTKTLETYLAGYNTLLRVAMRLRHNAPKLYACDADLVVQRRMGSGTSLACW